MKIKCQTNVLGRAIRPHLTSVCSYSVCFSLSGHPATHPLIRSSIQLANPLPSAVVEWEAVSLNFNSEGYKDLTTFYFFLSRLTSLKSSADYTAYSCYHIYALLQAPFYSHSRVSFRDLKITAHHMTPLSSSFSLLQLVGGDLKFCFKTATVPILLNPPPSLPLVSPPFLLSILPNPSELQSELLKTRSTPGSQLHR